MSDYIFIKESIKNRSDDIFFFDNQWKILLDKINYYQEKNEAYIDTLKAYILCHSYRCSRRDSNPIAEKQLIRKMIQEYGDNDTDKNFKEFIDEMIIYIYPKTITMYGFTKSIKSYMENPESQVKINKTIEILTKLNIEYFITYGTLLGYTRNKSLIPYDNDIDIAIKVGSNIKSIQDIQNELSKIKSLINQHCDTFWGNSDKSIIIIKIGKKGDGLVRIDLFPYWIKDDKVYIWPGILDGIDISEVYPLQEIRFLDNAVKIINNPNKLLEINYGANWTNPDPLWVFDWEIAKQKLYKLF